jgi:putative lipoic acid-binding regulatory protein
MTKKETSNNEVRKNIEEVTQDVKIEFPVTFNLKAVIGTANTDNENMINLSAVFDSLKVSNSYIGNKKSSKGTYVSYNYSVTLQDKPQLEKLYSDLKNVPGLKFAL